MTFALTSDGLNYHNFNTSARQNHQATTPFEILEDQPHAHNKVWKGMHPSKNQAWKDDILTNDKW